MKAARKFGVSFWPWRRLNPKQAKLVSQMHKKLSNQVRNQDMKRKKSQFFYQTEAKKLMSLVYGKLHTSYLLTLFKKANAHKGKTIANFFAALETRLDTTLYRVQFAPTLQAARQLITHQKICVNNVPLTKPGYILQPGDVVSIAPHAIEHVAQRMHAFLRAENTQKALHTVGVVKKFRARRRQRKPWSQKMRFKVPFFARRVLARKRMEEHLALVKHHTCPDTLWEKAPVTQRMRVKMHVKMRMHMMKVKRFMRTTLRLKQNLEKQLVLKRPKTLPIRFQRTAHNMPVKTWVAHVFAHSHTWKKRAKKKGTEGRTWKTAAARQHNKGMKTRYPYRFTSKKVFYTPTHLEVNYHTLHIVFLFQPQHVYFPTKLALQHVAGAFQR
jgi:ribosomal protein S4